MIAAVWTNPLDPGTGGDWRHASTDRYRECIPQMCFRFVLQDMATQGFGWARHALYVYYVGDTVTDSALAYRLTSGWRRLVGSAPHGLIGFRLQGDLLRAASGAEHLDNSWPAAAGGAGAIHERGPSVRMRPGQVVPVASR